jgi:hypothetical protein
MKIWTYQEMSTKVATDLDLLDDTFINTNEMVGYHNEALQEAESELIPLNQDYFLTMYQVPVVAGISRYTLPPSIYANRIRTIMYRNGAIIYEIKQYRRRRKFESVAYTDQYGLADDYRYLLYNDVPGQAQIEFHPVMRNTDTAVLAPVSAIFNPVQLFYLRNCSRVPIVGEYCNTEVFALTQVSTGASTIQTYAGTSTLGVPQQGTPGAWPGSIAYITGDAVKFAIAPGGTLPSPLVAGIVYYVIAAGSGVIQLATTLANALAGTPITLTTTGTVYFILQVAATAAIQNATLMDIPEFSTFLMQWVKCRCFEKEGDPRLSGAIETLAQQRLQMTSALVKGVDDDADEIQPDFSHYNEMS